MDRVELKGMVTFEQVQERLVEAVELWQRMPDPDARFGLGGRISSIWRSFVRDGELRALVDARTEEPRRPLPSRGDIGRMYEATDWIVHVAERDRVMVGWAVAYLASGEARVPWEKLWKALGRGRPGPDGLRKRYDQSISRIAMALNTALEQGW